MATVASGEHDFIKAPNRTLVSMSLPVLFSLVAEPMTGLADTAFVARLGSEAVAALGIGAMAFSAVFWVFNFLGIGTQTEVARFMGAGEREKAAKMGALAVFLSVGIGIVLMVGVSPLLRPIAFALGGDGAVLGLAEDYMLYRLLGAPAVLVTVACFGSLRGAQDMHTPLWVATGINGLNVLLDWVLIFGYGPVPAMGVAGAAIASSIAQWIGAFWVLLVLFRKVGFTFHVSLADMRKLFSIGGDLFIRTGLVLLFLSLCTRVANHAGAVEGAAYQAIRQFFIFAALFMDAFAITGQSLVGFFIGRQDVRNARRVAVYTCWWSVGTGVGLCAAMILGVEWVAWLLVPPEARAAFDGAWITLSLILPVMSLACATDGIHWGMGDFKYLRNAMLGAVLVAAPVVLLFDALGLENILVWVWSGTGIWALVRSGFGVARIVPGIGRAPLRREI
ncbi:MATE family efflux transporter [Salidesulfovibrio onnuriiensis]|uniref:MATE family efflux transporter n=1 Tax=Salidesulfovibrio onnuriiensis TaxID=2583823 RepID=UPI00202B1B29|nr:MATE family efflux transporter [Salidesulfovibrio onnuriiensis]